MFGRTPAPRRRNYRDVLDSIGRAPLPPQSELRAAPNPAAHILSPARVPWWNKAT